MACAQVLQQVKYLAMETVINATVAEILVESVTNQIRYLLFCKRYVTDMRTQMRELDVLRVGVENRINLSTRSHTEIPSIARDWLDQVQALNAKVENFPRDVFSCFSLRTRYKLGRKAFKTIKEIESVISQHSLITWTESMNASTSAPSSDHHDFQSREQSFMEVLKALVPSHYSHMIALCGMGGVGKTTMIKKIKNVVQDKKMFTFMVEVIIGDWTDPLHIQDVVASYLCIELKEGSKLARADKLRRWFEANSDGGKTKFLGILEDVWQPVNLEDIGLSHFPTQGVDFKVLLTSRDINVCKMMGVEDNSIIFVDVLTEAEGQSLFHQFIRDSDSELDPTFHEIADNIVRRCQGLPIAIKTLALSLKGNSKHVWERTLDHLEHLHLQDVANETFKLSYNSLNDKESESIFLLCGLFPPHFDIPIEELLRYGWGLKLFIGVSTIREARYRLNVYIKRLMDKNLLIKIDDGECVKMHDLVHAFVLGMFSEFEHASIVSHGSIPNYTSNSSYKSVSLTCKGMSEFPRDLKFPNISILKLMYGDKSLKFPHDFYEEMEKLQVISYYEMKYPLLPSSPQCSTNLRVLHLNQCSLMFDCSCIGNLLSLEVLSFANSSIEWLPSTIGNLKKLRILDLRGCGGLRIDNGVLQNLVKLEELYATVSGQYGKAISFTVENCNEMEKLSSKLSVLEFEFFENNAQPKNMSFENLERFKISVGRSLAGDYLSRSAHSFKNTLKLVTSKGELFESRMNELFSKTEVLCLSVEDMNDLEDVEVKSSPSISPRSSSFKNVRFLVVSWCSELRCLFTLGVAKALLSLEHLQVFDCSHMEELIYTEGNGQEIIGLPKLKFLSLCRLPNLSGLCHNAKLIQLPQLVELELEHIPAIKSIYSNSRLGISSFFKNKDVIPKLERLGIYGMWNLEEIWPREFHKSEKVMLREIMVSNCDKLVNMFPCNPITLLHHLEELGVRNCDSIEVLFNIDMDCVGEIKEGSNSSSLRSIELEGLGKLREVWRIKGADKSRPLVRGFQAVESIRIKKCERFRNIFTPTTSNFDLGALTSLNIRDCKRNNESMYCSQEDELTLMEEETMSQVNDRICNVVFPSYLIKTFHELRKLELWRYEGVKVVFEIESPTSRELVTTDHNEQHILPNLEELDLREMDNMSHVWKCNWNKFLTLPKQQSESPFHNLTTIYVYICKNIKYLFSPLMGKHFSNLKKVHIEDCDCIEEVVSNKGDEDEEMTTSTSTQTNATLFPYLNSLTLGFLPNLKCIGSGSPNSWNNELSLNNSAADAATTNFLDIFKFSEAGGVSWNLCQYCREISIRNCDALSSVIPCYAVGQMQKLQVLRVVFCNGIKEVFETQCNNKSRCDEGIPRVNNVVMLLNLKILNIEWCDLLEHTFTFSALGSLRQLQELKIRYCEAMKVIVKEEEENASSSSSSSSKEVVVFPRLKSIALEYLPKLEGFFLGMNDFCWPSLDKVTIKKCPQMRVFALGGSTAPQLKYMRTELGKHTLDEYGLNFHVGHHQTLFPTLASTSSGPATSEMVAWSFHNLIEMDVKSNRSIKKIIRFKEMLQLQKLEKIHISYCHGADEVFETLEGTISPAFDVSETTVVELPKLREVELKYLDGLRYIWKSNQWTIFEFPNLRRVDINGCYSLKHVFTSSMVGSLLQLQELHISNCKHMEEVIVKDAHVVQAEVEDEKSNGKKNEIIVLPRLKSLILDSLPHLKGFCLGNEDFSLPLLDILGIKGCPSIATFTKGNSATPQLKEIETSFGLFYAAETDINSFIKDKQEEFRRHSPTWM